MKMKWQDLSTHEKLACKAYFQIYMDGQLDMKNHLHALCAIELGKMGIDPLRYAEEIQFEESQAKRL